MTRFLRKALIATSTLVLTVTGLLAIPGTATAAEPVYPVMNTSEYPPDGIYFRSEPDWNKPIRVTGVGVYAGESIRLKCWTAGTNVPRPDGGANYIWYLAENVSSGRTTVLGYGANVGYINAHFVNDGTGPNEVAPGVVQCGLPQPPPTTPTTPTPVTQTAYFSPFGPNDWTPGKGGTVQNVPIGDWAPGSCDTSKALSRVPATAFNLAGWSKGRLGPVYALARADVAREQRLNTILMIDPGSLKELSGGCDNAAVAVGYSSTKQRPGAILARWLKDNTTAHLVIYAADATADKASAVGNNAHRGIQEIYFNDLRRAGADLSRVLVCNYWQQSGTWSGNTNHEAVYRASQNFLPNPSPSSCPTLSGFNLGAQWHP